MSPDERSERAQTEVCPFCGRPFKRLKSHIAHCKMAPVSKDTHTSKTSKLPDITPREQSATVKKEKKKKVMAKQSGLSDANLADIQSGPALKTKNTDPKEKTVAVKVSQNKKTSKTLDSRAVSAMKAKIHKNMGPEMVQPKREQEPGGKQQQLVRGTVLVSSKSGRKSPVSAFPSMEDHSVVTVAEKGPVPAASRTVLPGSKWSPTKGPLSWNHPKDKVKQSSVQSVPSPTGGAVAQASLGGSRTARVKAEERPEGSLQNRPRAKVNFWDDYSSWASVKTPGEDRQRPQRSEEGYSVEHPWTKTSVWDHIKEGWSCRSPGLLLTADRSEGGLKGSFALAPQNANPQDQVLVESGYHLAAGVRSEHLTETLALRGLLQLPPQAHTQASGDSDVELSRTMQRARGLEGTMELAAGYRGIGLSMFPQHLSTEHVQTKAPPIQPPATGSQGPLTEQKLMDMRLSELPVWLTSRRLLTPREAVAAVQRGWLRYYRKYIDVRKGGIGGIGMLLAGYCILSYAWNYPHIKQDRWRKYH